jgi:hypothetical protein
LQRLKAALTCALLAAATVLVVVATLAVRDATRGARALPGAVSREVQDTRAALIQQIAQTRVDLVAQVEAGRGDATAQLAALRKDTLAEVDQIRQTADRRVGDSLARVDTALGKVEEIRGDFQPVLVAAHSTLTDTDRTVSDLRPQLLGLVAGWKVVGGETAETMRDVRGAVPGFLKDGAAIALNVQLATLRFSSVADNVDRLTRPKWYDRLLGYGLNGLIMYRQLNPATNITVTGATVISSQK